MAWLLLLTLVASTQGFILTNEVCYGHYGCFSTSKPFDNAKGFRPEPPQKISVNFHLYTRQNTGSAQTLKDGDASSVRRSHFNAHHPTKLIVHGFQDSGTTHWILHMKDKILSKEDVNVIAVGWEHGADNINYFQAAANTRVVGAVVAELIKTLQSVGAPFSSFHIIGHSLGSHIAGYAGERIHTLGRITGLDPAGPVFENYPAQVRLDASDASFVDVIHSNSETLLQLGFGLKVPLGHQDFYPNGGEHQPGCPNDLGNYLFTLITGQIAKLSDDIACSHMRAIDLFSSSITAACHLTAQPCASKDAFQQGHCHACGSGCAVMGYHAHPSHRGSFYLSTTAHAPFCH